MNTHAQNIDLMKHALGKTPDSRHDLWQTYNTAGRALFSAHAWTWKFSNAAAFTFTGGSASLALPAQCDAVTDIYAQNGIVTRMKVVDINELYRMRSQSQVSTPDYFVATEDWANGTPPTRRIHIYPTPMANNLSAVTYTSATKTFTYPGGTGGAFPKTFTVGGTITVVSGTGLTPGTYTITATTATTIVIDDSIGSGTPTDVVLNIGGLDTYISYTRTWVDAVDPGAGRPNIPPDWERALILMARAFAAHIENQTTGVEDQAVNAEIDRLIRLDGEKQPNLGRIKAEWQRTRLPDFRVPVASISLANP
jgi:hypothetical protein